jgi:hypothetical protein
MNVRNLNPQYGDSIQFLEDQRYVDTSLPWIRTPSFLDWDPRSREQSPFAYEQMIRQFPWTGPGVLVNPTISYSRENKYKYAHNKWLNMRYDFNTQRCMYHKREWVQSMAMIVFHLPNEYKLHGMCACPQTDAEIAPMYFYLNLLYRDKKYEHLPRSGANDMVKLLRYLETMPKAPPAVYYIPHSLDTYTSPHLEHLNYERGPTTEELTKIWKYKLGGIKIPGSRYWIAGNYRPKDPAIICEDQKYDKFEDVLAKFR